MATLDPLLRAVADHGMEALVLEPGELPRLARNGTLREVTRTRLDDTVIRRLAREVAPGEAPEPTEGDWEFEYRVDGRPFRFSGTREADGWCFRAGLARETAPAPPQPEAAPGEAPAPRAPETGRPNGLGNGNGNGGGTGAGHEHRRAPTPTPSDPEAAQAPPQTGAAREQGGGVPLTTTALRASVPEGGRGIEGEGGDPISPGRVGEGKPSGGEIAASSDAATAMEQLLRKMVELGASDLHLSPGQPVRLRLDGDLGPFGTEVPGPERTRELLRSIAPEARLEEFEADYDADFGHEIPGVARFRVNLFRDRLGMGGVFRQIPESIPSADDLGLPKPIRELAQLPKGLVLVTGPTGSGKSTTLAAILDLVNRTRQDHVITIEDPIEFVHPSKRAMVNQREVGDHTRSFARALRAALREDPDVVLVGEMRDLETTAIAIETAETGHLVFATLHTTSAIATIERLVNQFPADRQEQVRLMLADSLKAVVSQTLLKRIGGGRVAAQEILLVNRAVANLIRENKTYQILSVMQTGRSRGNVTLNEALVRLVSEGTVEPREAYLKAVDRDDLLNRYRTEGIDAGFLDHLDDE